MRNKDIVTLGDIYGQMFKQVKVVEEVCELCASDNIGKSKKTPKMPENAFTKKNELQKGGPQEKGGFHKALNDSQDYNTDEDEESESTPIQKLKNKLKNENLSEKDRENILAELKRLEKGAQNEEAEERLVKESKKIARDRLNTFMTKKSTFDKLYESVMGGAFDAQEDAQEVDALGLGDAPTDDEFGGGEDLGDEDDQVTVTLSRSVAQELLGLLQTAVGGEEEFGDEGDDLDFEGDDDFGDEGEVDEDAEEDDDFDYQEDEERGTFPTDKVGNDGTVGSKDGKGGGQQHPLQGKNNKVSGKPQPKNQSTKVVGTTDKVGNDGDYGHGIGGKQPNIGKQNKVSDIRQSEDFFR